MLPAAVLISFVRLAPAADANGAPEPAPGAASENDPSKPARSARTPRRAALLVYAGASRHELWDIPIDALEVGVGAERLPKGQALVALSGCLDLMLGDTEAGLRVGQLSARVGVDFLLDYLHVEPSLGVGVFWLNRVTTDDSITDPALSLQLRAGPQLALSERDLLALDASAHFDLVDGTPLYGYGLALRYTRF
jgi:hypothetical protein